MPIRTCAVCRTSAEKNSLLRFVAVRAKSGDYGIELDVQARLPGRGVYCHAQRSCLGTPKLEGILARCLRRGNLASVGLTLSLMPMLERAVVELQGRPKRLSESGSLGLENLEKLLLEFTRGGERRPKGSIRFRL